MQILGVKVREAPVLLWFLIGNLSTKRVRGPAWNPLRPRAGRRAGQGFTHYRELPLRRLPYNSLTSTFLTAHYWAGFPVPFSKCYLALSRLSITLTFDYLKCQVKCIFTCALPITGCGLDPCRQITSSVCVTNQWHLL